MAADCRARALCPFACRFACAAPPRLVLRHARERSCRPSPRHRRWSSLPSGRHSPAVGQRACGGCTGKATPVEAHPHHPDGGIPPRRPPPGHAPRPRRAAARRPPTPRLLDARGGRGGCALPPSPAAAVAVHAHPALVLGAPAAGGGARARRAGILGRPPVALPPRRPRGFPVRRVRGAPPHRDLPLPLRRATAWRPFKGTPPRTSGPDAVPVGGATWTVGGGGVCRPAVVLPTLAAASVGLLAAARPLLVVGRPGQLPVGWC